MPQPSEVSYFLKNFDFLPPEIKDRVRERLRRAAREKHPELTQDRLLAFVEALFDISS